MNYQGMHTPCGIRKITLNPFWHDETGPNVARTHYQPTETIMPGHTYNHPSQLDHPVAIRPIQEEGIKAERHEQHPDRPCIFVIDDSPTICILIETALQQAGYNVQSFQNAQAALTQLETPGTRLPDLLFVDLVLPQMDGYEFIQRLKSRPECAKSICIVLSRRCGLTDMLKGKLVGAQAYVTKPFTIQTLLTTVQTHLYPSSIAG